MESDAMSRKKQGGDQPPPAPPRLSQIREPIVINPTALYTAAALRDLLHLPDNTLAGLKRDGRLRASRVSNTDVYLGQEVLDCLRRCAELPQVETPDSSAA